MCPDKDYTTTFEYHAYYYKIATGVMNVSLRSADLGCRASEVLVVGSVLTQGDKLFYRP